MKTAVAKTIRVLSVPPIMVTSLLLILHVYRPDIFHHPADVLLPILLLGVLPALAYPFQYLFPSLKEKGRAMQRRLAFIFSCIGYLAAVVWALAAHTSNEIQLICITYFISVIFLTFFNKVLKKRASGHACSVSGPLVFLVCLIDWKLIFPCVFIALLIFWSSLYLKRHTKMDLLLGVLSNLLAFGFSFCITML